MVLSAAAVFTRLASDNGLFVPAHEIKLNFVSTVNDSVCADVSQPRERTKFPDVEPVRFWTVRVSRFRNSKSELTQVDCDRKRGAAHGL